MSEVELVNGRWIFNDTAVMISTSLDEIQKRIDHFRSEAANLEVIRDAVANSKYSEAIEAMLSSDIGDAHHYGDRFIEGYMAALESMKIENNE